MDVEKLPAPLLLEAGKDPVHAVAFSPDGGILAAGDGMSEGFAYRGKLYLWETRSGKPIAKHAGFRRPVERICFSDSGKVVAASTRNRGPVIVWEVGKEDRKAILSVNSCVLGLTSETDALVGVERSDSPEWDVASFRFDRPLTPEDVVIRDVGYAVGLSGNKHVLFGCYPDGKVVFWSAPDWKKLGTINVGESFAHTISDDGKLFATRADVGSQLGVTTIDIWDVRGQKLLRRQPSTSGALCNMVFHGSGEILAENYGTSMFLRDLKKGHFFATWSAPIVREGPNQFTSVFTMTSLAFSRDGEALAAGLFHTKEVALFRIAPGDLKRLRDTAKAKASPKD